MGSTDEDIENAEVRSVDANEEAALGSSEKVVPANPVIAAASTSSPAQPAVPSSAPGTNSTDESDSEEDGEEGQEESHREQLTEGEDDPLAPAYDLDDGELMDDEDEEANQLPWSSRVEQARDFFNGELLYRFDLLVREQKETLRGAYRIEVRGNQGGVWTMTIGDELTVVNRREDAETVLSCYQRDFLQIVNGEINPQLAILAQKMRITGDLTRGIAVQSLLSPQTE